MNVQINYIRYWGKDNLDAFGNWLKVRTTAVFDNVGEFFKQYRIQQEKAKNNRNRSMKAHHQDSLNNLPLKTKHSLGLYHLMD